MGTKVEAEGGELILRNDKGDIAIIPANHRQEVLDMIKDGCDNCLDDYIRRLPKKSDYAEDGTVIDNPWKQAVPNQSLAQQYYEKSVQTNTVPVSKPLDLKQLSSVRPQIEPDASNVTNTLAAGDIARIKQKANDAIKKKTYEEGDDFKVEPIKVRADMKLPTNKEAIITLQRDMYNKGYYKPAIDVKNYSEKDEIYDLQVMLKSKGYNISPNRTMDEATIHAVADFNYKHEVDGIVGKRTRAAFEKYKELTLQPSNFNTKDERSSIIGSDPYITDVGNKVGASHTFNYISSNPFVVTNETKTVIPNCTKYVNTKVREMMSQEQADAIGIYGDAWTIRRNLLASGGKEVFNVGYSIPTKFDLKAIKNNIATAIKKSTLPVNSLVPGQYVELYNPGSDKFKIAYSEGAKGGTITTHVGIITADDKNNLYVEHNVHGKIYKERIEKFASHTAANGVEITRVIQPAYNKSVGIPVRGIGRYYDASNLGVEFQKKSSGGGAGSANSYLFQKAIVVNKPIIQKNFGLNDTDFAIVNKIAYAVAAAQSQFGNAARYKDKVDPKALVYSKSMSKGEFREGFSHSKLGRAVVDFLDDIDLRDESKGYGQVKEEDLFGKEYIERTGINKLDENSPEYGALTTASAIAAKYKVLSTIINEVGVSVDRPQFESLLIMAHNQGFDNIKQDLINYKKTGNYNYIKQYDKMIYSRIAKQTVEEHVKF